jgi:hypothetical protein
VCGSLVLERGKGVYVGGMRLWFGLLPLLIFSDCDAV